MITQKTDEFYIPVQWLYYILYYIHCTTLWGVFSGSAGKESSCNAGDTGDQGFIPGSGRSPGGGNGNPLQDSCLENPVDRGAWWATVHGVAKSQAQLSNQARA